MALVAVYSEHVVQARAQVDECWSSGWYVPEQRPERVDVTAYRFAIGGRAAVAGPALLGGFVDVQARSAVVVEGTDDLAVRAGGLAGQQTDVMGWLDLLQRVVSPGVAEVPLAIGRVHRGCSGQGGEDVLWVVALCGVMDQLDRTRRGVLEVQGVRGRRILAASVQR